MGYIDYHSKGDENPKGQARYPNHHLNQLLKGSSLKIYGVNSVNSKLNEPCHGAYKHKDHQNVIFSRNNLDADLTLSEENPPVGFAGVC